MKKALSTGLFLFIFLFSSPLAHCTFKVKKCCAEHQYINENDGSCKDITSANFDFVKETSDEWEWWFPKTLMVKSVENGSSVPLPKDREMLADCGAPCDIRVAALLPTYLYDYEFYEDGSVEVEKNDVQPRTVRYDPLTFCVDRFAGYEGNMGKDYMLHICPCEKLVCILKCCHMGFHLTIPAGKNPEINEDNCVTMNGTGWRPPNDIDHFTLHHFPVCSDTEEIPVPDFNVASFYDINPNGSAIIDGEFSGELKFCGEEVVHKGLKKRAEFLLRCKSKQEYEWRSQMLRIRRILYGTFSAIGAFFLILTLIVYVLIRKEKTVNDKNVISQTWSLLIGYIGIAVSQFALYYIPHWLCVTLGYIILYFFLASFFWLNVLCIDLAWAFSELRLIRDMMVWQNRRRFLQYALYSWLSAGIIVIVTIFFDFFPGLPDYIIVPEIKKSCWFRNDSMAKLAYFYGPIAVLLAVNIVLFAYTAFKIWSAQNSSTLLKNATKKEKQRFYLYVKLFALMGLSWVFELLSWAIGGPDYYWYGTDLVNLLRAAFIFITLCCKRVVYHELKARLTPRPIFGRQTASPSVVTMTTNNVDSGDRRNSHATSYF